MPVPVVEWYMNGEQDPIQESQFVFYVNNRYLLISSLTAAQRNARFRCVVTNAYLGTNPQTSPTTYSVSGTIPTDELTLYSQPEVYTVELGAELTILYAASYRQAGSSLSALLVLICWPALPVQYRGNGLIGTLESFDTTGDLEISCVLSGAGSTVSLVHSVQVRGELYAFVEKSVCHAIYVRLVVAP